MATASAPTAVKVCNRQVHNGTERVPCSTIIPAGVAECPNKHNHIWKVKTGHCGIGSHEGNKPKSNRTNKPLPTCKLWQHCACKCHADLDAMFKMLERERQLVENPEYVPEKVHFDPFDYLPKIDLEAAPSNPFEADAHDGNERPMTDALTPVTVPLSVRRTESGRAAKGGLEAQVWEQCVVFSKAGVPGTPRMISDLIAKKYNIAPPSTGAIGAVFNRWEALGYAEQGRKPVRFIKFTGDGSWEELAQLKAKKGKANKNKFSPTIRYSRQN